MRAPYDFARATFWPFMNLKSGLKLIIWYLLLVILFYVLFVMVVGVAGAGFANLASGAEPSAFIMLLFIPFGIGIWMVYASYITAFHKRAIFEERQGFFPLRFGGLELKVMLVQFVWFWAFLASYFLFYIVLLIPMLLIGGLAQLGTGAAVVGGIIGGVLILAAIIGYMYFLIRMSLTTPLTVANNKFTFLESFSASKGRGWWMFLSLLVAAIVYLIVYIIGLVAIFSVLGMSIMDFGDPTAMDPTQMGDLMSSPVTLIIFVLGYIALTLMLGLLMQMFSGVGSYVVKNHKDFTSEAISEIYA